jgi:hypothetical protein
MTATKGFIHIGKNLIIKCMTATKGFIHIGQNLII